MNIFAIVMDSDTIFRASPDGSNVLPEYKIPLSKICVNPIFMKESTVTRKIGALQSSSRSYLSDQSMEDIVSQFVMRAFGIKDIIKAKSFRGMSSVRGADDREFECSFYNGSLHFYHAISAAEGKTLKLALMQLIDKEDADGCHVILSLMCRASTEVRYFCPYSVRLSFS